MLARMNICVFCSANDLEEKYTTPAKELAQLLAQASHHLVWGGSNYGLMRIMADGMQQGGSKLVGISMELFKANIHPTADEMVITQTLGERKAILLERADLVLVLAGGLGTLDEATEVLELRKQGWHDKDIIVLNTDGFYDGFKIQLERMATEGFLPAKEQATIKIRPLSQLIQFVDTPTEAMALIEQAHCRQSNAAMVESVIERLA
jgi:uncharacterized protein (TIGR00730 family)